MIDIVLEIVRALVLLGIVIFLWTAGRARIELARTGWTFIIGGFGLLLFGSLVDITDNFEYLNRFVVIGDTETEAILEKFVGFLGGFVLLAIGLARWISGVQRLSDEFAAGERAAEALRRQSRSSDLLRRIAVAANEIPDANQAMKVCLDEVCAHTGWPVGHVYEPTEEGSGELRPSKLWHLDDPERHEKFRQVTETTCLARGIGLPGRVLASGHPAWITDVTKDANFPRAKMAGDIGVKAGMAFPVLVGKEVAAVMEFFSENASEPDPHILEVMAQAGTQLGRAIERRRAEEALRESERKYRTLANVAPVGIYHTNAKGQTTYVNRSWTEITGLSLEDSIGSGWIRAVHPEDRERVTGEWDEAISSATLFRSEFRYQRPDGKVAWCYVQALAEIDQHGAPLGYVGTVTDITERKRAEDALCQSEQQSRNLIDGSIQGILIHRGDTPLFANQALADIFGYDGPEEIVALPSIAALAAAHERERLAAYGVARLNDEEAPARYVFEGVRKDGGREWLENFVTVVAWNGGPAIQSTTVAITRHMRAEAALRESEAALTRAQRQARIGSWRWSVERNALISCSEEYARLHGVGLEEIHELMAHEMERSIHPDDGERVAAEYGRIDQEGLNYEIEYRIVRPDGEVRHVLEIGEAVLDEAGQAVEQTGTVQDITDRKQAEEALAGSEARLRAIMDNAPMEIYLKDAEGRYLEINRHYEALWGIRNEEVRGKLPGDVHHEDGFAKATRAHDLAVLTSGARGHKRASPLMSCSTSSSLQ